MGTVHQTFGFNNGNNDGTWDTDVRDMFPVPLGPPLGADLTSICSFGQAAYTDKQITVDPFTTRATVGDSRTLFGWELLADGAVINDGLVIPQNVDGYHGACNGLVAADRAEYDITSQVRLACRVAFVSLTPAGYTVLMAKWWNGSQSSYLLDHDPAGKLYGAFSYDGAAFEGFTSTVTLASVGITAGAQAWLRCDMKANNGAGNSEAKFYYSLTNTDDYDAVVWTQLGATVLSTTRAGIFNSNEKLWLGGWYGAADPGTYRAFVVENIATATRVVDLVTGGKYGSAVTDDALGQLFTFFSASAASKTNAVRIIPAGVHTFTMQVTIPAPATLGSIDCQAKVAVYRVSAAGARTLLFTADSNTATNTSGAPTNNVLTAASASQGAITLAAGETIMAGVMLESTQVGTPVTGTTVANNQSFHVGTSNGTTSAWQMPGAVTTQYARTGSESAPAADADARVATFPRAISESAPGSDASARSFAGGRSGAESAPATDSDARGFSGARAASESAPAVDADARAYSGARTLAESAPAADAVARAFAGARPGAESAPASDAVARGFTGGRAGAESAPATDATARAFSGFRAITEAAPATDVSARTYTAPRSTPESAPATDTSARAAVFNRTGSESAPATDATSRSFSGFRSMVELAPALDAVARALIYARSIEENIGPGGSVTPTRTGGRRVFVERQQTGEARRQYAYFSDAAGNPLEGLLPTARAWRGDTFAEEAAPTVTEIERGWYAVELAAPPVVDLVVEVDGGALVSVGRYVPLEFHVGGWVDRVDVATSTRASAVAVAALAAAVGALGFPAQAADLQAVADDVDALGVTLAATAALLAARLDVAVSTRATDVDVDALRVVVDALSALATATLDVAVSTRMPKTGAVTGVVS